MESASNSAEGLAAKWEWRAGFRKRIYNALEFLGGQDGFGKTQSRHFNAFNQTYSTNQRFRYEVGKLSPFEMEVLCISSTPRQLEDDLAYFTAAEVTHALAFKLQDHRRGEIRNRILSDGHGDLPRLYHTAKERAIPDEDDRINDIQRWIQASLNNRAIQRLLESMGHEHAIVPLRHQANGIISPAMQTNDSQIELLPPTSPTGPVTTVRDLRLALKEPRPRKSMLSFLRFVFESGPLLDQLALDRKLKLRKMDPISLVLCSATYTEKMVLGFSEGRFRVLHFNCCEFLGGPGNVAATLPIHVVDLAVKFKLVPEDHKAYAIFLRGLEEYQRARKATPPLLPPRIFTPAERLSNFGTSVTWPQEHVAAILIQILDIAAEMLTDSAPPSTRATIVHQRSVTLRLLGNSHQAEREILSFLEKTSDVPELLLKSLKLSLAESRVYQFRHHEAHDIARSIEVGGDISEFQLLWDHIYCHFHLLQAKSVLEPAVKSVGQTDSKSRRRLLLSLSEVYIRQLRVHEATTILEELITLFDGLKYPDIIDRLGHVRMHMTLARLCPSSQSMTYWREALRLNKAYNPDEEEVFTCAVIYLNLSWLSYSEGQLELGREMHARAGEILQERSPQYLMPGIGTYVYKDTWSKLQTKTL
ncbi:hypothetical protein LA080_011815 [Diaporthe eres]|nr:hypothetical protein LA080_011815 [Diaporthe eres]